MKISRFKKAHKILSFYMTNFEYREPYQIIIDATFCQAALKNKIGIDDQLRKYFQGDVKLLTTQCIILEAESLGPALIGATGIVKKYHVHKCGHEGTPIPGSACIRAMTKTSRYIVATQDRSLQNSLRRTPGRALLYLHKLTPVLEPPSDVSKKFVQDKLHLLPEQVEKAINKMKDSCGIQKKDNEPVKAKRKVPKNPNPLSCKKKKSKPDGAKPSTNPAKQDASINIKKKRKRVKISSHVKDIIQSSA